MTGPVHKVLSIPGLLHHIATCIVDFPAVANFPFRKPILHKRNRSVAGILDGIEYLLVVL